MYNGSNLFMLDAQAKTPGGELNLSRQVISQKRMGSTLTKMTLMTQPY
jgi:hypothetical protein